MRYTRQTESMSDRRKTAGSLVLAFVLALWPSAQLCLAQGLESDQSVNLSSSPGFASGQESLLPPEVVPLDPEMAEQLTASQAQARAASTPISGSQEQSWVAGQPGGMQTAQEFRQAAFNSLYGNEAWNGQYPAQQYRGAAFPPPAGSLPAVSSLGQHGLVATGQGVELGQSQWVQPSAYNTRVAVGSQSQVLTGGVKNVPSRHSSKRGGLTNALSAVGAFGSGVFLGSVVRRPNTALGLGLMGLTLSGLGVRNGFRF